VKFSKKSVSRMLDIPSVDDLCCYIKEKFYKEKEIQERLRDKIKDLEVENELLKKDLYKDKDYAETKQKLKELKQELYRGFPVSKEEDKQIFDWIRNHNIKHSDRGGAIGGKYSYVFTPTSIGIVGEIKCVCGESFCFRELD